MSYGEDPIDMIHVSMNAEFGVKGVVTEFPSKYTVKLVDTDTNNVLPTLKAFDKTLDDAKSLAIDCAEFVAGNK